MIEVKLLSHGFFEAIHLDSNISKRNLERSLKNILIYFELPLNDEIKFNFDCGYFNPVNATTFFNSKSKKKDYSIDFKIIKMRPSFFVFLLPYPTLYKTYKEHPKFTDYVCASNPKFFFNKRRNRFSYNVVETDLKARVSIGNILKKDIDCQNYFMDNNCYPLFVEEIQQLRILIDDYNNFLKSVFDFEIGINSLSKIIIPFFDIHEFNTINGGYEEEFNDDLPF